MYQIVEGVKVWGKPEPKAVEQAITCSKTGNVVETLLMADHHKGYSLPIGGVVAFEGQVSPSGVNCGVAAS